MTCLHRAALSGNNELVEFLCQKASAKVNEQSDAETEDSVTANVVEMKRVTPLYCVVTGAFDSDADRLRAFRFLINEKADINVKYRDGNYIAHIAAMMGQGQIMQEVSGCGRGGGGREGEREERRGEEG